MKTQGGRRTAWIGISMLVAVLVAPRANAVPLPLDGSWTIRDQDMRPGDFFTGNFDFTSSLPVLFRITDLYVVSDQFEVYDGGTLVFTTPSVPDWSERELSGPYAAPWTADPDDALASGFFSNSSFLFAPGTHSLTIRDIHIPPGCSPGNQIVCQDGTVAFQATPEELQLTVRESQTTPVSEPPGLLLLATGFVLISSQWRRLSRPLACRQTARALSRA